MSQERRQVAERVFRAINVRDRVAVGALLDPDVEIIFHSAVEGAVYRGIDGVGALVDELHATWEHLEFRVESVHDVGDRSVVLYRLLGRARASGIPIDERVAQIWTWRSGRPWRCVVFTDRRQALEAVGLRE
jgi:ketosteroid isomerase-like protein